MIGCETFAVDCIASFGKIIPDLINTSLPNTSPSPARVQIATIFKNLLSYDYEDQNDVIANGLPIAEKQSEILIHPFITGD
ncbi:MAG: hypothetical protein AAB299_03580 [Thermodesulfobacteriota bacterium]